MARHSQSFVAVEHQVLGVAFLALLALFGWLTYAIFNKTFADFAFVTLRSDKAGLQLPDNADVKIRGVIVGEVRGAEATDDGVELELGLHPDSLDTIPADVTARLLPKTLFGEKYVALQVPASPSGESIEAGAVIEESEVAIEVERVLSDIYPLLRTVQPAQVNYTLTAMATALEGRGESIGENLVILDDYLQRTNPKIPLLVEDLRKLGQVSDVYRDVVPEVANLLRNSVTTGQTFVEKEQKIQAFFGDVAGFSATSQGFLERNGDNMIRLSEQGQAQLPVFAKYAPEYPCLLQSMVDWLPTNEQAFRGYTLHINLETLPSQPRGYNPSDDPAYGEKSGPMSEAECRAAPSYSQANLPGTRYAPPLDTGVDYPVNKRPAPVLEPTSGYAGAAERDVVNSFAAPAMGVASDDVPDVATLLLGPLARGYEVSVR